MPDRSLPAWKDRDEAVRIAVAVMPLLPPSLRTVFDAHCARSHMLFDEFVNRLTLQVLAQTELGPALRDWSRVDDVIARGGLEPRAAAIPLAWMLERLAARGILAREHAVDAPRFRAVDGLPALDPAELLAEQRAHDPSALPSYTLAETAARDYPAFLRGKRSGDEILLAPMRLPLWVTYFSNDNYLYAVNNRVAAAALEAWMPPGPASILEIGGGLASGATAALDGLTAAGRIGDVTAYRFTELVTAFLRRGQRVLEERFPGASFLSFAPLDMTRPFGEQGVAPGSVTVVYAVNTLHVAHDLAFTLGEARRALAPGGRIVISECVRLMPGQCLYPEFIFNLMESFRHGGFLSPEHWTSALEAAGFGDVRVLPDTRRLREVSPTFHVAAIGATRRD